MSLARKRASKCVGDLVGEYNESMSDGDAEPTGSTEPTGSGVPDYPPPQFFVPPSAPSGAVPSTPPNYDHVLMCQRCRQRPAVSNITARWVQSYGMWFSRRQSTAALCEVCGHQVLDEASTRSLTRGMWGPAAAATSFITVNHNNEQRKVLPPVPKAIDGQQVRRPAFSRPIVWVAIGGWLVVIVAVIMWISGFSFVSHGSSDLVGTCWTDSKQAEQVACTNRKASDKVVGIASTAAGCQKFSTWDGYYLPLGGTDGYACLEKLTTTS
jgi:hypothetical protein